MTRLAWDSVLAWRLERQHLAARAPRDAAVAVVSDVAGLHAQVASCAELMLWARVEGLEPGAVSALLWEERALVKTWAMRGTLHLLASAELPRFVAALSRCARATTSPHGCARTAWSANRPRRCSPRSPPRSTAPS